MCKSLRHRTSHSWRARWVMKETDGVAVKTGEFKNIYIKLHVTRQWEYTAFLIPPDRLGVFLQEVSLATGDILVYDVPKGEETFATSSRYRRIDDVMEAEGLHNYLGGLVAEHVLASDRFDLFLVNHNRGLHSDYDDGICALCLDRLNIFLRSDIPFSNPVRMYANDNYMLPWICKSCAELAKHRAKDKLINFNVGDNAKEIFQYVRDKRRLRRLRNMFELPTLGRVCLLPKDHFTFPQLRDNMRLKEGKL